MLNIEFRILYSFIIQYYLFNIFSIPIAIGIEIKYSKFCFQERFRRFHLLPSISQLFFQW